ncbi:sterile alpha motif domain-containing protein 9-like [Genypterus blacodes]|uniref:sterile alpha motif domain-containing protein 9-like n=1 Tax=Genypterus blacodes TaxID=154954 RepID=UPI003F75B4C4
MGNVELSKAVPNCVVKLQGHPIFRADREGAATGMKYLATWCADNNLALNTKKIMEIIVDFRYKSFAVAATLDRTRLQAKFAREVIKFAAGCMNIRSNGTIHFGVMDSMDHEGYMHGEIICPVEEKDMYVDALDHIEKSFTSDMEHARLCVQPPRFIEVIDRQSREKRYVVEVDIVPSINVVKRKVYSVCLPNFKESSNKIEREKKTFFKRVGAKTKPVGDPGDFYQQVKHRDDLREEAEKSQFLFAPDICITLH